MSALNPDDWKLIDCPMGNACKHLLHASTLDPSGWIEIANFSDGPDLEADIAEVVQQFHAMLASASLHREKVEGKVKAEALRSFADQLQRDFSLDSVITVRQMIQRLAGAAIYHEAIRPELKN